MTTFLRLGSDVIVLSADAISVPLTCEQGHQEQGSMVVSINIKTGEYNCTGGSAWDHCENCGLECGEDCDRYDCSHGWRSDESREAGYRLVENQIDQWWTQYSSLVGGFQDVNS